MMKKIFLCLCVFIPCFLSAQNTQPKYTILLSGASFASSNNGWFELACNHLGAVPLNRAVEAEAIADAANRMMNGTLYTKAELEDIDAFVLMHVHDEDVADESQLKKDYKDYKTPFDRSNYAAAYDYVIKRYMSDCYNLKFDKGSKYYGTHYGKAPVIVLCTNWHDGRTIFNHSVRALSSKWGFPLVEFDKYIGFSKNAPHPVTGEQVSLIYSIDEQDMEGVKCGWHPLKGKEQYIQQRFAAIFADTMRKILPLK